MVFSFGKSENGFHFRRREQAPALQYGLKLHTNEVPL